VWLWENGGEVLTMLLRIEKHVGRIVFGKSTKEEEEAGRLDGGSQSRTKGSRGGARSRLGIGGDP